MGKIDPERAMFEALNIISKSIDKYESEGKLEKPIDVEYTSKGMWYNGKYIDYPKDHSYDHNNGFVINGEPRSVLCLSTKDFIFATNSKQFEYYIDIVNGRDKALSSIKAAWISLTKLMMNNCDDITLVSTSDHTDILMVDGSKYNDYGDFKISLNSSILVLTKCYITLLASDLVMDLISSLCKLDGPPDMRFITGYMNKITKITASMEAVFISIISGINVQETVIEIALDIIQNAISNTNKKEE